MLSATESPLIGLGWGVCVLPDRRLQTCRRPERVSWYPSTEVAYCIFGCRARGRTGNCPNAQAVGGSTKAVDPTLLGLVAFLGTQVEGNIAGLSGSAHRFDWQYPTLRGMLC